MSNIQDDYSQDIESELGIGDIVGICVQYKYILLIMVVLFAGMGALVATLLPTYYMSDMLIKPRAEDESSSSSSGLAGLGALAGGMINTVNSDTELLIEQIKSRVFILSFIKKNKLNAELVAVIGWDALQNKLIYDEELYNPIEKKWLDPELEPQPIELYNKFMKDYFTIAYDDKKNLITLQILYYDPARAYEWLNELSKEVNIYLQQRSQIITENRLKYLEETLGSTSNNTMQMLTGDLIKEQLRKLMMNNFNDGFAFEVIDPPLLAHKPVKSQMALFMLLGGGIGFFISLFSILLIFNKKE